MWGLFARCWRDARRNGTAAVWKLVAGVLFGLLLEAATLRQLHAYRYGHFAIMFGDVPLAIGMGWGVVICSVSEIAETSGLPVLARPVLSGLLALNIDLSMDAIAIRLGMWDWGKPLNSGFFGVPFGNFWAWFWVVFSFSSAVILLERSRLPGRRWLAPLGGIILGVLGVLATNYFIVYVVPKQLYKATVFGVIGAALLLVLISRPRLDLERASPSAFWTPFSFHVYFLAAGLISGAVFRPPWILAVSGSMFGLSLALHAPRILRFWRNAYGQKKRGGLRWGIREVPWFQAGTGSGEIHRERQGERESSVSHERRYGRKGRRRFPET